MSDGQNGNSGYEAKIATLESGQATLRDEVRSIAGAVRDQSSQIASLASTMQSFIGSAKGSENKVNITTLVATLSLVVAMIFPTLMYMGASWVTPLTQRADYIERSMKQNADSFREIEEIKTQLIDQKFKTLEVTAASAKDVSVLKSEVDALRKSDDTVHSHVNKLRDEISNATTKKGP